LGLNKPTFSSQTQVLQLMVLTGGGGSVRDALLAYHSGDGITGEPARAEGYRKCRFIADGTSAVQDGVRAIRMVRQGQ
jgi:hypothetical protein